MGKSINQVLVMGNVTRDPELRQSVNGQSRCSFSLALNRSYKDSNDEWQEATDYVDLVAWGKLAEQIADRLSTGSRVLVSGRLQTRSWDHEGTKRSKTEILAIDVTFLDKLEETQNNE